MPSSRERAPNTNGGNSNASDGSTIELSFWERFVRSGLYQEMRAFREGGILNQILLEGSFVEDIIAGGTRYIIEEIRPLIQAIMRLIMNLFNSQSEI